MLPNLQTSVNCTLKDPTTEIWVWYAYYKTSIITEKKTEPWVWILSIWSCLRIHVTSFKSWPSVDKCFFTSLISLWQTGFHYASKSCFEHQSDSTGLVEFGDPIVTPGVTHYRKLNYSPLFGIHSKCQNHYLCHGNVHWYTTYSLVPRSKHDT